MPRLTLCRPRSWNLPQRLTQALLAVLAVVLLACGGGGGGTRGGGGSVSPIPEITGSLPAAATPGVAITLTGVNLAAVDGVTFTPSIAAPFTVDSDTQVTTTVPPGAQTGPITVTTRGGRAATIPFTVAQPLPEPVLNAFAPDRGRARSQVTLAGSGFTGATGVTLGGVAATWFSVASDTQLLVAVPEGAASGRIAVATRWGTATSATDFTFDPATPDPPAITSLAPLSGPVNTVVRLFGNNLLGVTKAELAGVSLPFTLIGETELMFAIPFGAATGPVTLTGAAGATATSLPFTVTPGPAAGPSFLDFTPRSARPGQKITITGTGLASILKATVGGQVVTSGPLDDNNLILFLPESVPVSGPIVLAWAGGTVTHPVPLAVDTPPPSITAFDPPSGPEGTPVWIQGTGLATPTDIRFGSTRATSLIYSSPSTIKVLVPKGATQGPVTVTTAAGRVQSIQSFTVTAGTSTADTRIAGLYVTQATQRLDRSVPLVAGRKGRVRVFLEAGSPNRQSPSVRVTLADAGGATLVTRDIAAPRAGVPTRLDDTLEGQSWDFDLDGAFMQPGTTLQARILGASDLASGNDVYPAGGAPLPLNVVEVPPIGITLIPVRQGGTTGRVTDATRTLDSWLTEVRRIWPLKEIDLVQAPVMNWSETVTEDGMTWARLRNAIEVQRLAANPRSLRYHYGVIDRGPAPGIAGLSQVAQGPSNLARSAVGWDGDGTPNRETYSSVFAHELGHNLRRAHSPCGGASGPDPSYPYPDAELGATGFDPASGRILHPAMFKDIMSYCSPQWVSDHVYKDVLANRAWELATPSPHVATQGMVVWGTIHNGEIAVEPAFQTADVSGPPVPGDCTLLLRDATGAILQEVPFEAREEADLPQGQQVRSFAFTLALSPEVQAALASMEVVDGSQAALGAVLRASRRYASPTGLALPRDPVATAWGPGTVHLSWDAATHPMVMVTDPASGAVIGMVEGGSADLLTDATELDLNLSAGVRSVRMRVKVTP